jgi:hypothetical protein
MRHPWTICDWVEARPPDVTLSGELLEGRFPFGAPAPEIQTPPAPPVAGRNRKRLVVSNSHVDAAECRSVVNGGRSLSEGASRVDGLIQGEDLRLVDVGADGRQVEHLHAERHSLEHFLGMRAGPGDQNKAR